MMWHCRMPAVEGELNGRLLATVARAGEPYSAVQLKRCERDCVKSRIAQLPGHIVRLQSKHESGA